MIDEYDLTKTEQVALKRLRKLAATWPKTLSLFSNAGSLEVHKNAGGDEPYSDDTYIVDIYNITNDGGDRDSLL